MKLEHALAALYRAGKLKRPWLPGMLLRGRATPEDKTATRMLHVSAASDAWMDRYCAEPDGSWEWDSVEPATVGCLLALLREAAGCSTVHVSPNAVVGWAVWRSCPTGNGWERIRGGEGESEGLALTAALVTLAESINPEPSEAL